MSTTALCTSSWYADLARARSYWRRLVLTASPGMQQRFQETMDFFFQAVTLQAQDRANGVVPDLDSYIWQRRDTSGCKPCWALIEYAYNLTLPDEVMEHPIIVSLGEAANDLVTWSNVRDFACFISELNVLNVCMATGHLFLQCGTIERYDTLFSKRSRNPKTSYLCSQATRTT